MVTQRLFLNHFPLTGVGRFVGLSIESEKVGMTFYKSSLPMTTTTTARGNAAQCQWLTEGGQKVRYGSGWGEEVKGKCDFYQSLPVKCESQRAGPS